MQPPENHSQNPYLSWPLLPELFPASFPGVRSGRDDLVMDIDRERLVRRMEQLFTAEVGSEPIPGQSPLGVEAGLGQLQQKRQLNHQIIRLCYRPFDLRWRFEGLETKPFSKKQLDYLRQAKPGNLWLAAAKKHRGDFNPPFVTPRPASQYLLESRTYFFPLRLHLETNGTFFAHLPKEYGTQPNLSKKVRHYLADLGANEAVELLFYHLLAILYAPQYRAENGEALRQDWPRLPLPNNLKLLQKSAGLGQKIAALLDTEKAVPGVTTSPIRPDLKTVGVISRVEDDSPDPNSESVAAAGPSQPAERPFTADEQAAFEKGAAALGLSLDQLGQVLGETTLDIYFNNTSLSLHFKN